MQRKGSVLDLMFVIIGLFAFSVGTFIAFTVYTAYFNTAQTLPGWNETQYMGNITANSRTSLLAFDGLFVFMTFGMMLVVAILAYYSDTHPILFVMSFVVLILVVFLTNVFSSATTVFATADSLSASAANFPTMQQIWANMPIIVTVFGFIVLIVAYAKIRSGGGQGV